MKKGAELALNFMLRLVFGMIAIFLINGYLQEKGLDACVGINALSALTSGFLGLPGVALLYGVRRLPVRGAAEQKARSRWKGQRRCHRDYKSRRRRIPLSVYPLVPDQKNSF